MIIEDEVNRHSYRGFELVQLREGFAKKTRWHITDKENVMIRSHGFTRTQIEAQAKIDDLLKRK